MVEQDGYRLAPAHLLGKAREALAEGDLVQASEKGWAAAAQAVKALSRSKEWPQQSHRDLFLAVRRLVTETGDKSFGDLFEAANGLHTNFYEGWMPSEMVAERLVRVEEFVERLEVLGGRGALGG